MNNNGILKIADFGLAKFYGSPNRQYTHIVVTRWYRAPELLFGARNYGTGVDVWAVGCILAELLLRIPFVAGDTDLDQLGKIFQVNDFKAHVSMVALVLKQHQWFLTILKPWKSCRIRGKHRCP